MLTGVCTNGVEGKWGVHKRRLRKLNLMHSRNVARHLDTLMWRELYGKTHLDAFHNLIGQIKERYPQRGKCQVVQAWHVWPDVTFLFTSHLCLVAGLLLLCMLQLPASRIWQACSCEC